MSNLQFGPMVEVNFVDKRRADAQTTTSPLGAPLDYTSVSALETRLDELDYTAETIGSMTLNDKIFAVRLADDSAGL